jgi:hypothetical protein
VKALEGERKGRVIAHMEVINLKDVSFKVSQAGRQRVLREKRKNVHAGVVGAYAQFDEMPYVDRRVRYNPYLNETFVDMEGTPVYNAAFARISAFHKHPTIFIERENHGS